jgi:uncharacterized protein YdaU (DUF1376 family)
MEQKVDIFMPFYVGDYLRDTAHLSLEEHGAYSRLLLNMWGQRGHLPLDHARLARLAGTSRKKWERIWPVIAGFFEVDKANGSITQKRLALELDRARDRRRKASESGRRGGLARRPRVAQATLEATPQATLEANDKQKPSSSPSPSPSPSDPDPPPSAGACDPPAPVPEPATSTAAPPAPAFPKPGLSAQWVLETFSRIRADKDNRCIPWDTPPATCREKAQSLVDQVRGRPTAQDEIKLTIGLFFDEAQASGDESAFETAFGFSTWRSQHHDLLEQARGLRPAAKGVLRSRPARASPPKSGITVGMAKPSSVHRKGDVF